MLVLAMLIYAPNIIRNLAALQTLSAETSKPSLESPVLVYFANAPGHKISVWLVEAFAANVFDFRRARADQFLYRRCN
jgi:hypothetical protein